MLDDGDYCIWDQRFGIVSQNIYTLYVFHTTIKHTMANGALENREFIYCLHHLPKQTRQTHTHITQRVCTLYHLISHNVYQSQPLTNLIKWLTDELKNNFSENSMNHIKNSTVESFIEIEIQQKKIIFILIIKRNLFSNRFTDC